MNTRVANIIKNIFKISKVIYANSDFKKLNMSLSLDRKGKERSIKN